MDSTRALQLRQQAEDLASRLPPLLIAAKRVAVTSTQGAHGRRRTGAGEAFWQFARYSPEDSAQRIDWRQSARSRTLYVREREWEAAQSLWIWRDGSPSMNWRSNKTLPSKRERADLLSLALTTSLLRAGERVAFIGSGRGLRTGVNTLHDAAIDLTGQALLSCQSLPDPPPLPRHAEVVLIGDFLLPPPLLGDLVATLAARNVRGHLLQVLDPEEETLPNDGRIEFHGLEGEAPILIPRVEAVRARYRQSLEQHRQALKMIARSADWTFLTDRTDYPPQKALLALWQAISAAAGFRQESRSDRPAPPHPTSV